ncbi:MAG TPA: hypothetical protein VF585_02090 [Chthoniobacterales bacterium]|jgi:hypothetical protein
MTTSGLLILILSVGSVTGLLAWCIWKLLTAPAATDDTSTTDLQ